MPVKLLLGVVTLIVGLHAWGDGQSTDSTDSTGMATAAVPRPPEEGGPRRWQPVPGHNPGLREKPSDDAAIIRIHGQGTVLSNLGCEALDQRIWCRVQTLHGKQRGYMVAESLQPAVGPDGAVAVGVDDSARRARKGKFDVNGQVPCAQERGQQMGECAVGVARSDGGDATVVVFFPNGFKRTLYFAHGEFISANATMSGSGSDTDWVMDGGVHAIRVDDQRYELRSDLIVER